MMLIMMSCRLIFSFDSKR